MPDELFDTRDAFCLTPQDGTDGHALLREKLEREAAAVDLARRQLPLPLITDDCSLITSENDHQRPDRPGPPHR